MPATDADRERLAQAQARLDAFQPGVHTQAELEARIADMLSATDRAGGPEHAEWLAGTARYFALETAAPTLALPVLAWALQRSDLSAAARARLLADRAEIQRSTGALTEALAASLEAYAELERSREEDSELRLRLLAVRGQIELASGLLDLATRTIAEEERVASGLGAAEQAVAAVHRIQVLHATEAFEESLQRIEAERARASDPQVPPWLAAHLAYLAGSAESELARGRGDAPRARDQFARVLADPRARPGDRLQSILLRADLDLRVGDAAAAARGVVEARRLLDAGAVARTLDLQARLAALDAWLATFSPSDAPDRAESRARLAEVVEAFLAERSRSRSPRALESPLWFGDWRLAFSELVRAELEAAPRETATERALGVLYAEQVARPGGHVREARSLDATLARLARPGRGILVLFPAMERTHAFAWDAQRGFSHHELARRDDLRTVTQELLASVLLAPHKDPDPARRSARFRAAQRAFTASFLPPDLGQRVAGWSELLAIGAEMILAAPLDLALLPDGREVGLTLGVSYCSSLPLAAGLAEADAGASNGGVLVGVAARPAPEALRLRGDLLPIPFEDADLAIWRDAAAPWPVQSAGAAAATPAALLRAAAADRWSMLVLLAHGVYDPDAQLPAGLALEDSILRGADLVQATGVWPPEVLLLACGASRGVARFGNDTATHLGTLFLAGGARCVLVGRGDLELAASTRFVSTILRERARGGDLGQAVAAGRRALADEARTQDPFYRGLVALHGVIPPASGAHASATGDAPRIAHDAAPTAGAWLRPVAWGGAGLALLAGVLVLRRRRSRAS